MVERLTGEEERTLRYALSRASEQGWGIAIGLGVGLGLWVATVVLVVQGGPDSGPHLLGIYFPGYRVTWLGACIGFVYGFVGGYAMGRTVATIYNRLLPAQEH